MSNWYVRRSRERFWAKGMEQDKINAYMTLYTALVTVSKLAAPMVPFITEDIYQNLVRGLNPSAPESIHLCNYPVVNADWIDSGLEQNMDAVLKVVVMGRACRNTANIKNRQPISQMFVKAPFVLDEFYSAIIKEELNVKAVKYTEDVRDFTSYSFKPQMRTLGPKYGRQLNEIRTLLAEMDGNSAMDELKGSGWLKLKLGDGIEALLAEEDLLIDSAQTEGYVSEASGDVTVVIDTNLTPELLQEGMIREIISKVQTMRKEAGFEVMDHICISVMGNEKITALLQEHGPEVLQEVLAESIVWNEKIGYSKEWNVNGEDVVLGVEKI